MNTTTVTVINSDLVIVQGLSGALVIRSVPVTREDSVWHVTTRTARGTRIRSAVSLGAAILIARDVAAA